MSELLKVNVEVTEKKYCRLIAYTEDNLIHSLYECDPKSYSIQDMFYGHMYDEENSFTVAFEADYATFESELTLGEMLVERYNELLITK